jgi:isoamylase
VGELAKRVAGSYDLFAPDPESERSPFHSINFVTCHDGFTLNDLVSFNDELSDLPEEAKVEIETLRRQQIKNFLSHRVCSDNQRRLA